MDYTASTPVWKGVALLARLAVLVVVLLVAGSPARAATIDEFPLAGSGAPNGMTLGADMNIWFTEPLANKIGRMTAAGALSEYSLPTPNAQPLELAVGPDNNIWFTEFGAGKIGRITPAGAITEFALPAPALAAPWGICSGPDGNLWFTSYTGNAIGRMTTSGVVTAFPLPTPNSGPVGIASAAGYLWFTEFDGNRIGRITTAGAISELAVPNQQGFPSPQAITEGPDGNLWFTERWGNRIVRMTTAWVFTEYAVPTAGSEPYGIFNGWAGGIWFTERAGNRLGLISVSGPSASLYEVATSIPTAGATPTGIALDENGDVWFSETGSGKLCRYRDLAGTYQEYSLEPGPRRPFALATRLPDVWFTEPQANRIGRLTVSGANVSVAEFALPTAGSLPWAIAPVPGGTDVWFTEYSGNRIGKLNAAGFVTEYALPVAGSGPCAITALSNGDAWFSECGGNRIGRVTAAGVLTEYPIPTPDSWPAAITYGPLGSLWFTEGTGRKLGQVLLPQVLFSEYTVPTNAGSSITWDRADQNVWYTIDGVPRIGKFDVNGTSGMTEFTIPVAGVMPRGISGAGRGRKLWFVDTGNNAVARITTAGAFAEYPIPTPNASPQWTAIDSQQDVWFTEQGVDKIGRLVQASVPQTYFVSKAGTGSGTVTSSPSGISCGASCTAEFPYGQSVSLTATASPGSVLTGWNSCSGLVNPCVRTTWYDNEIIAYFTGVRLTVAKYGAGSGTVVSSPAGISCGGTCTYDFTSSVGQPVVLTASPLPGSVFAGWTGEGCGGTGTCTVTMSQARTVTATFFPANAGTGFYPLIPCRIADTRNPNGPMGGPPLYAGLTRAFTVSGVCGVPSGATAVALNVTVTGATAPGTLTLFPGAGTAPGTTVISFGTGTTRANNSIMGLVGGVLSVLDNQSANSVHFILDVSGYFR